MVFFRKKPSEERVEDIKDIAKLVEEKPLPELPPHPQEERMERKQFAPLFVKIERYRAVLSLLNDVKATLFMIKNALEIQKQLESLKDANHTVIESAIAKVEDKITALDNEFTRPPGYEEAQLPLSQQTDLDRALDDLKKRIDDLRVELKSIA